MVTLRRDNGKVKGPERRGVSHHRHRFTPVFAWALLVGLASVTPISGGNASIMGAPVPLTLLAHLVGYAVLTALLVRARVPVVSAVLVATMFGLGIEGNQLRVAMRTPSAEDAVVNLAGSVTGALAAVARRRHAEATTGE